MGDLGKLLIGIGGLLVVLGLVLLAAGKLNLPLGRLPGDITWRGKHSVVYFPIVTCIVLSVLLSVIFWLVGQFRR
jgi:hypothetical protein